MADCFVSEVNKNINSSSKQSSDVPSCQDVKTEVMEPLLLEDFQRTKIPTSLSNILKVFEDNGTKPNKPDFLVGCVYILMLEYGFIPQNKELLFSDSEFNYTRINQLSHGPFESITKASIKFSDLYSSSFILPPDELYVCEISCIKINDDLIINASVRNIENAQYTLMLDILSYFTDGINQSAHLNGIQNMRALSRIFKDQIAFPIKHNILSVLEQKHPCMEDLPMELIHHIFKYINGIDIVRLTSTCKRFYIIRQDAKLWKYLLKRDHNISTNENNYKELFAKYRLIYRRNVHKNDIWKPAYTYWGIQN